MLFNTLYTDTQDDTFYDHINVAVDVSGGGTLEIQTIVDGWTTFKTVTSSNDIPEVRISNAMPLRFNVTGAVKYRVY